MTRVAVFGAAGRMGATVCAAVLEAADLELVAAVDPAAAGRPLREIPGCGGAELEIAASADAVARRRARRWLWTSLSPRPRAANLRWCADNGVHAVCGTTGTRRQPTSRSCGPGSRGTPTPCVAPNFSIGAALMMRCAELCAPFVERCRGHRATPRQQARRPFGDVARDRSAGIQAARDAGGCRAVVAGSDRDRGPRRAPGADGRRGACTFTRFGCPGSWPTRR